MMQGARQDMCDDDEGEEGDRAECLACGKMRVLGSLPSEEEEEADGKGYGQGASEAVHGVCRRCIEHLRRARRTRRRRIEAKACGHLCTVSSVTDCCCACADLRPILGMSLV